MNKPIITDERAFFDRAWEQRKVIETAHRIMTAISASHYEITPVAEVRDDHA